MANDGGQDEHQKDADHEKDDATRHENEVAKQKSRQPQERQFPAESKHIYIFIFVM